MPHDRAVTTTAAVPTGSSAVPGCGSVLDLDTAWRHVEASALTDAGPGHAGRVGLELEGHVVDLARPGRRPAFQRLVSVLSDIPSLPYGSAVTVEPGGQVELSTPPKSGAAAAIHALQVDGEALATALAGDGLGLAFLGADPARASERINPASRYVSMEQHFTATGQGAPRKVMMCSTAALQVNLDAGPQAGWEQRVRLAYRLGPVLVAMSACSPLLGGSDTGWRSARQRVWGLLDQRRSGPLPNIDSPSRQYAQFAMQAPVMLTRDPHSGRTEPVVDHIQFADWVTGRALLAGRRPDVDDLDCHLSTLFPQVRLRGYLELRFLDAVPRRWWPALACITTTLMNDPRAADVASEAVEPVTGAWERAAREGLRDPELARAAARCVQVAAAAAPPQLRNEVHAYAELVTAGRCPGDAVRERAQQAGPLRVLQEEADG